MIPSALLITKPIVDFDTFLAASQQALGRSLSREIDASLIKRSDVEKFIGCLAALRGVSIGLLEHVSFSVLIAANDRDMLDILQIASMPFVVADTLSRGIQLAVVTGSLAQWKVAVKIGSNKKVEFNVRAFFNRVMSIFQAAGVDVWKDCEVHQLPDKTLLLEDKR